MPRVERVAKCRVDQAPCEKCRKPLPKGSAYIHWTFRFGWKHTRCTDPTCYPKPSELTQSEIKSNAYAIQETDISEATTIEDLEELRGEAAQGVEEIVDLIQEKLEAIEEGMGHANAPVYEELDERRDEYECWEQEIEGVEFEEFDEYIPEDADDQEKAEHKTDWFEDQRLVLQDALDNCPE